MSEVHKEIEEIVKRLEANGHSVEHGGKHLEGEELGRRDDLRSSYETQRIRVESQAAAGSREARIDLMEFTVEIETVPGFGSSDFVDLVAELVYADSRLVAPSIGVNGDGSITVAFEVSADDAEAASTVAFSAFGAVISAAATRYASGREGWPMRRPRSPRRVEAQQEQWEAFE